MFTAPRFAIITWFRLLSLVFGIGLMLGAPAAHAQTVVCYGRTITALDFRSPTLVSGTALTAGAVYRFANVATGIDARVTIVALNGATLATIDNDTGLIGNFQPELVGANARSVDFTIRLVVTGTTTPIALDVAASGVDIDGDGGSIREYAEFSTPFAAYVLDGATNLDVNASGPSVASNVRFEARTSNTAAGIDETSTPNIVSILYTSTSVFNYRIGTLGTGSTTRLTSLDFGCPALTLPSTITIVPQDFGDAPASYGNPVHDIVTGFRIGATNTSEPARYNSPTASGDTGDDGVTIAPLRRTQTTTATVTVAGLNGRLQCWIDFNGDGDFLDSGEQVATNIGDNLTGDTNAAVGTITFNITTPAAAILTQTFARCRWSTTVGLNSLTTASNGEVEDYAVTILGLAALSVSKTSVSYDTTGINKFSVPASDMIYTITTTNTGSGSVDNNSLFMVDVLPATVEFFNGDFDGAGPATGAVLFTQTGAGLTFTLSTDVRYSNLAAAPASFAACTYTPAAGYDPAVRYICFNPKGVMLSGGTPTANFTVQFKARIK